MSNEIPTVPVTAWELRTVPDLDAVMVTISFLVSPMQPVSQANLSPNYVLHTKQLRELALAMLEAAEKVESERPPSPSGPKH